MASLNTKGMERLNAISTKYRFQDTYEIEQHEVYDFCHALFQAHHLGLRLDMDDLDFILTVMQNY